MCHSLSLQRVLHSAADQQRLHSVTELLRRGGPGLHHVLGQFIPHADLRPREVGVQNVRVSQLYRPCAVAVVYACVDEPNEHTDGGNHGFRVQCDAGAGVLPPELLGVTNALLPNGSQIPRHFIRLTTCFAPTLNAHNFPLFLITSHSSHLLSTTPV